MNTPHCWNCGHTLNDTPLPIGIRDECPACAKGLHVCRQCRYFDPKKHNQCHEVQAERVVDKTRSNFCDYFQIHDPASSPDNQQAQSDSAKQALEALFGGNTKAQENNPQADKTPEAMQTATERLNSLFK